MNDDWSRHLLEQGVPEQVIRQAQSAGARLADAARDAFSDFDDPLDPPRLQQLLRAAAETADE